MIAANISTEPGLFYLYLHLDGLFSINFLSREINIIFEVDWGPGITFYHCFNNDKIVINKYLPGINTGHHEIEFYDVHSKLTNPEYIFNKNNQDSIQIDALAFAEDTVFLSIRKYQKKYIENYFGSYDLTTKEFYFSPITLPWSINPYYPAYSPKRKEVYTVGKHDKLFVIDTSRKDYQIKIVVDLPGKSESMSRLLLHPDKDVVFISSSRTNLIFVVDLIKSCVVKKISIDRPYLLLKI